MSDDTHNAEPGYDPTDDKDVLAAEYVLGTLDADQRAEAQRLSDTDSDFVERLRKWERRLGELNVLVAPVEPPEATWERIKAKIGGVEVRPEFKLPRAEALAPTITPKVEPTTAAKPAPKVEPRTEPTTGSSESEAEAAHEPPTVHRAAPDFTQVRDGEPDDNVIELTQRVARWRTVAVLSGGIAAVVVAFGVVREFAPQFLPPQLRPAMKVEVVEKPVETIRTVEVPSPRPAQYVAVLQNKDAPIPAFLLTFDLEKRTVTVRTVGAAKQTGKSYQLWLIHDKYPKPRSLGLVGSGEFTERPQLVAYDALTISHATYAVSLEPEGGSPKDEPTGPVLFTGPLIQAAPPGFGGLTP